MRSIIYPIFDIIQFNSLNFSKSKLLNFLIILLLRKKILIKKNLTDK